jgi:NADP-dependent 3-hydroxy acid dehydrogenase YdfG
MAAKTALITGASSGIGAATARALAKNGWKLLLVARRKDRLEAIARELDAQAFAVDLSQPAAIERFAREQASVLSGVSALVNNAGLARGMSSFQDSQAAEWAEMIDVNVRAVLQLTHAMIPHFQKAGGGHIVNLGSVAGRWVYPKGHVYCMTKAAIGAFTQALRHDLMGQPIRVTEISPGMVETEFSEVRLGDAAKAKAVYAGMQPLTADDIADAIAWALSRPAHVNVQEMVLYPVSQAAPGFVARR